MFLLEWNVIRLKWTNVVFGRKWKIFVSIEPENKSDYSSDMNTCRF